MLTQDLFELLKEEIEEHLAGKFEFQGDLIKYEYDGFQQDITNLEDICYDDHISVSEWLDNNKDYFEYIITEPEIHDNIFYFYIENNGQ